MLANLLAMPIVSAWIMPAGMLALLAIPFGLDDPLWRPMGMGIDRMDAIALWVAGLPCAVGRVAAFGGALLLCTAGLVMLCLMRSPLRWCGGAVIAASILWALRTPLPDVLIAPSGDAIAVRAADGRLAVIKKSGDTIVVKEWLAADADARTWQRGGVRRHRLHGPPRRPNNRCARNCARGVRRRLSAGGPRGVVAHGAAELRGAVRMRAGAMALRRVGAGWEITLARPDGYERPGAKTRAPAGARCNTRRRPS